MSDPLPHAAMLHVTTERPIVTALTPESLSALQSPTIAAVLKERVEQVDRHGYDAVHDQAHDEAEIGRGALAYLIAGLSDEDMTPAEVNTGDPADIWPWDITTFHPSDYYGCLIKAAAMCIAEADRVMIARAILRPGIADPCGASTMTDAMFGQVDPA